ncbi:Vacuolar membrane protease [Sparganum proliferum]
MRNRNLPSFFGTSVTGKANGDLEGRMTPCDEHSINEVFLLVPLSVSRGPFIAQVTMSAFICKSLNFPEPPYPEKIVCPEEGGAGEVTFFNIVRKVQVESILWGFGTAMGELPPYFMARGARLASTVRTEEIELTGKPSSSSSETEPDHRENGNSQPSASDTKSLSGYQRLEMLLQKVVMRAGFFGIVLCASVPNPLFDLAGMTCGHFLVPFSTFFGATCIGKALIKVHIQQFAVIAVSSEDHIDTLVHYIGRIPVIGEKLQQPFMEYLQIQREKLHNKVVDTKQSWLQLGIGAVVAVMMLVFIVSIVESMAQTYHRRQCQDRRNAMAKKRH